MYKRHLLLLLAFLTLGHFTARAQMTWIEVVKETPTGFNLAEVDTPDELAWVISLVNGANGQAAIGNIDVTITGDIDMSAHLYVPIGTAEHPYTGKFRGNGYSISGLNCPIGGIDQGLFGHVAGDALITEVFVNSDGKGCSYDAWYLPSAGQWRQLEAALPFLNTPAAQMAKYAEPTADRVYWTSSLRKSGSMAVRMVAFDGQFDKDWEWVYARGIRDFNGSGYQLGDVFTFYDGAKGVVFYVNRDDTGGWVVACNDACSFWCNWLPDNTVFTVDGISGLYSNSGSYHTTYLQDLDGQAHTMAMRNQYGQGWYSAGFLAVSCSFSGFSTTNADFQGTLAGVMGENAKMTYCQGAGTMMTASKSTYMGGLVGHLTGNATVHSCMAMAKLNGYNIGGLVGKTESGTVLKNSFSNVYYGALSSTGYDLDGFVGRNAGDVENCYSLTQNQSVLFNTGWHLPSAGEMREVMAAYSIIPQSRFTDYGGTAINPYVTYWTSSLYNDDTPVSLLATGMISIPIGSDAFVRGVRVFNVTDENITNVYGDYQVPKLGDVYEFKDIVNDEERLTKGVVYWIDNERKVGWAVKIFDDGHTTWAERAAGPDCYNEGYDWSLLRDRNGELNMNQMLAAQGEKAYSALLLSANIPLEFKVTNVENYVSCYSPTGFGYPDNTKTGTFTPTETPYYYNHADNQVTMQKASETSGSLLKKLNDWVKDHKDDDPAPAGGPYETWMRPCASQINGDYPILKLRDFTSVAMRNNVELDYGSAQSLLKSMTEGDMLIYGNDDLNYQAKNDGVRLFIDENASLLHTAAYTDAYVSVTAPKELKWHMFSTPLKDAPLGIDYTSNEPHAHSSFNSNVAPYSFYPEDERDGYFPSKVYGSDFEAGAYPYNYDYYCFYEPEYHWINFKREGDNHWHEDGTNGAVEYHAFNGADAYENEEKLVPGKGYLIAVESDEGTFLQSHGTLNGGESAVVQLPVTVSGENCNGYNLMGNPYPSYLDFDMFVGNSDNANVLGGLEYLTFNDAVNGYIYYVSGSSSNSRESKAPRYIHSHQGFFVHAANVGTLTFNELMRSNAGTEGFRGNEEDTIAYPLVNLFVTDGQGRRDVTIVELGRPEAGGAFKMHDLHYPNCIMYAHYEDEDYSIAFTKEGESTIPIWFETFEDATYSLTWNTQNGTFDYLHIIDNLTGTDIDCLSADNYTFTSKTSDYKSRFKLVFSYNDVEENEEEPTGEFAFFANGNLMVNGQGYLELVDLNGRVLYETRLTDTQNTVSLPDFASGMYLLRLANTKTSKAQKIIIK